MHICRSAKKKKKCTSLLHFSLRAHIRGSREPGGEPPELDAGQPQQAHVHRTHREIRSLQEPTGDSPPVRAQVGRGGIILLMPSVLPFPPPRVQSTNGRKAFACARKRIVYACAVAARRAERANKAACLRRSVGSRSKALKRVKVNNLLDIRRGEPLTLHSLPSAAGFLLSPSSANCSSRSSAELFAGEEGDV